MSNKCPTCVHISDQNDEKSNMCWTFVGQTLLYKLSNQRKTQQNAEQQSRDPFRLYASDRYSADRLRKEGNEGEHIA